MFPPIVARAAWVVAAAPSKTPFYVIGAALAVWAVLLSAVGATRPEFPRSWGQGRLVIAATVLLVGGTMAAAVVTAGSEGGSATAKPAGGGAGGAPAAAGTLALRADPTGTPAYDKKSAAAPAGTVAVRFVNPSPIPHDVTIAQGGKVLGATKQIQSATATTTVKLAAGRYDFYCSVDAHRQAGMAGTLTVR
jgi:plastocyanin